MYPDNKVDYVSLHVYRATKRWRWIYLIHYQCVLIPVSTRPDPPSQRNASDPPSTRNTIPGTEINYVSDRDSIYGVSAVMVAVCRHDSHRDTPSTLSPRATSVQING